MITCHIKYENESKYLDNKLYQTDQGQAEHQTKIAADDILIFYFYLSKKIRLIFHVNPLPSRGFTRNIKTYFL